MIALAVGCAYGQERSQRFIIEDKYGLLGVYDLSFSWGDSLSTLQRKFPSAEIVSYVKDSLCLEADISYKTKESLTVRLQIKYAFDTSKSKQILRQVLHHVTIDGKDLHELDKRVFNAYFNTLKDAYVKAAIGSYGNNYDIESDGFEDNVIGYAFTWERESQKARAEITVGKLKSDDHAEVRVELYNP